MGGRGNGLSGQGIAAARADQRRPSPSWRSRWRQWAARLWRRPHTWHASWRRALVLTARCAPCASATSDALDQGPLPAGLHVSDGASALGDAPRVADLAATASAAQLEGRFARCCAATRDRASARGSDRQREARKERRGDVQLDAVANSTVRNAKFQGCGDGRHRAQLPQLYGRANHRGRVSQRTLVGSRSLRSPLYRNVQICG